MAGTGIQHVVLDLPEKLPLNFSSSDMHYAVVTGKTDWTLENRQVEWYIWNQCSSVLESLSVGSVAVVRGSETGYNKLGKPTNRTFTVIIAKESPGSYNRLKIVRDIVQEMYKMRNEFSSKNQDLTHMDAITEISERVVQQNLEESQPFFEACRRNWVSELDEDEYWCMPHQLIQPVDIIETIVMNVLKLAWPF